MGISTFPAASAGGITARTLKQKVFNASGTWTYPTSSNFDGTVEVTCVAGGGGSGAAINRQASGYYLGAGAGGGGQVILRRQLSVLNKGNQNVVVGNGGPSYYQTGALFGGVSTFGSGYIKNLYPDPALSKGLHVLNTNVGLAIYPETRSTGSSVGYIYPNQWTSGSNPPQPPVGRTYAVVSAASNGSVYGQYVPVKASTEYRVIFSHTYYSSGGVTVSPYVFWFDSTGTYLSSSGLTSFTTQSSSGTWSAVTSLVTSPAGAVYGRIMWNSSSSSYNFLLNGIQFAESAANITSVVYGGSSGYVWTGVPENSYTVAEDETLVAAQGGGGGWGAGYRITNSGTTYYIPGHVGYTSGGLGLAYNGTSISSSEAAITGCGGGAGGNAKGPETPTQIGSTNVYAINSGSHSSARYGFITPQLEYMMHGAAHSSAAYAGSDSFIYSMANTTMPFAHFGENGVGVEGYGYGGIGAAATGTSDYNSYFRATGSAIPGVIMATPVFSPTSPDHQAAYYAKPNSGNGGNGWLAPVSQNSTSYNGITGGSGVVIVRWYE